jgi:hypothetical protein
MGKSPICGQMCLVHLGVQLQEYIRRQRVSTFITAIVQLMHGINDDEQAPYLYSVALFCVS